MRSGALTDIIKFYEPVILKNEYGEQDTTFQYKLSTRSQVRNLNGNRAVENNEIVYDYTKTFCVRSYITNYITEFYQLEWNGHMYRILEIEPDRKMQQIIITAERINE